MFYVFVVVRRRPYNIIIILYAIPDKSFDFRAEKTTTVRDCNIIIIYLDASREEAEAVKF